MGHFISYNTSDGDTPLASAGVLTLGPVETGIAAKIAGIAYADVAGTLVIQQAFFGTWAPDPTTGQPVLTANWDAGTSYSVAGGSGVLIDQDVLAPFIRLVYTNSGTNQTVMRVAIRVFGAGRNNI